MARNNWGQCILDYSAQLFPIMFKRHVYKGHMGVKGDGSHGGLPVSAALLMERMFPWTCMPRATE